MQRVINIIVSVVFLISFLGINIHKHYSQGKLYSIAIFQEAESCCEDMAHCEMTNTAKTDTHHQKEDCSCKNETETLKISDVFIGERFSIPNQKIVDLGSGSFFQFVETIMFSSNCGSTYSSNSPPCIHTDIQSEFGVFLI